MRPGVPRALAAGAWLGLTVLLAQGVALAHGVALAQGVAPGAARGTAPVAAELPRLFVGYHETWSENAAGSAPATRLAGLPAYVNVVVLAFARPDVGYRGGLDLTGTGLQVPFSGAVLRDAAARLRERNPGTRVLLSVGGATYHNWRDFDPQGVARLVRDLGLDGVDLDYEPEQPGCRRMPDRSQRCASDHTWRDLVSRMRAALPRPALLAVPGWSVAAYGEGAWAEARPVSPWTGNLLALLRSPEADHLDFVSIMAYGADARFDPLEAFAAYRAVWDGPLALGVMVPPDPVRGPHYDVARVDALARAVAADPKGGMMLYTLQRRPPGPVDARNPDAGMLARTICRALALGGCHQPLP